MRGVLSVGHPREQTSEYRETATAASVLLPTVAFWAALLGDGETTDLLARFVEEYLGHCNLQLWLPGDDSEANIYLDAAPHGAAFDHIPVGRESRVVLDYVLRECGRETPYFSLSAVEFGHWPLIALACRHHRLPIPPHLWIGFLADRDE